MKTQLILHKVLSQQVTMPVNRAQYSDARYDQFVDSEPSRPSTAFQAERTRFASDAGGEMSMHHHHHPNFQPPTQDMQQMPSHREMRNQKFQEEVVPDYLKDDHAFYLLASSILSEIQRIDEGGMNSNASQKSTSITLVLQKTLSIVQINRFHEAIDIRLKCMPKYTSEGESDLCSIVRRCDEIFGIEMKALLYLKGESNNDRRDQQPRVNAPWQNKRAPENAHTFLPPPKQMSNVHKMSEQNDLTDHIIWDNDWDKRVPKTASNDTDTTFHCDSLSNGGSHFNDGEVYDIIVGKEEEMEGSEMNVEYNAKDDNDDKSVASIYSLSRVKALQVPGYNRKMVSVKAPETLPENFMFEARMNDDIFMVNVVS